MYTILPKSKKKQKELLKSLTIEQKMKSQNKLENVDVTEDITDLTMRQNTSSTSMTIPISNMEIERQYILEQQNPRKRTVNLEDLARRTEQIPGGNQMRQSTVNHDKDLYTKDKELAKSKQTHTIRDESEVRKYIFELFEKANLYTLKGLRKALEEEGYKVAEKLTKQVLNGSEGGADAIATYERSGPYQYFYHLNNRYSKQYEVGDRVKIIKETLQIEIQENPDFPRDAVYIIQDYSQDSTERKYRLMDAGQNIIKHKYFEAFEIFSAL